MGADGSKEEKPTQCYPPEWLGNPGFAEAAQEAIAALAALPPTEFVQVMRLQLRLRLLKDYASALPCVPPRPTVS